MRLATYVRGVVKRWTDRKRSPHDRAGWQTDKDRTKDRSLDSARWMRRPLVDDDRSNSSGDGAKQDSVNNVTRSGASVSDSDDVGCVDYP